MASTQAAPQSFGNYPLKEIPSPHPHDVLCGRGGGTNNHVGNSHWRMLVAANKQLYVTLPKRQKMLLSRSIVNAVRSQNPPGRFLQKDAKSELWYDVGDQRAQEKTSQALREGAPDIRQKLATDPAPSGEVSTTESTKESTSSPVPAPKRKQKDQVPETGTSNAIKPSPPVSSIQPQHQQKPAPAPVPVQVQPMMPGSFPPGVNAPPGSTPVMVYGMPQNGMPGMPMYQAMVTPDGNMVPIAAMPGAPSVPGMPPAFPPPVPSQAPDPQNASMPPPENITNPQHHHYNHGISSIPEGNQLNQASNDTFDHDAAAAMMTGVLEPSGISFGSVSMTSVGNGKLEPAGTSFGSMMSFTVASKAPDMVDGGLEPIGTSFGSLSLNTVEQGHLERALGAGNDANMKNSGDPKTFATPPIFSQQRSTGNLLECSDTESEDEEEEVNPHDLQASKTAEWEKLKAMLEAHTDMEQKQAAGPGPIANMPQHMPQQGNFEPSVPHTGFDRDFSNISALSMGEFEDDFDNLVAQDAAAMPPPPPMQKADSDVDREQLEMMYLAQGGGM